MCANLYRLGKKLSLHISINYIDGPGRLPSGSDKRGHSSVSKTMLIERDAEIDAEQASGQHSLWRDVYRIMRCPVPPCRHEGQYCWQDPDGKKHYKLRSTHMKTFTKHVQQGGLSRPMMIFQIPFANSCMPKRISSLKAERKARITL